MISLSPKTIKEYKLEYLREDYFECHEIIEKQWLIDYPNRDKNNGYIVLLQFAVAIFHIRNQNYIGSEKLLTTLYSHYSIEAKEQLAIYINLKKFDRLLEQLKYDICNKEHNSSYPLEFLL